MNSNRPSESLWNNARFMETWINVSPFDVSTA